MTATLSSINDYDQKGFYHCCQPLISFSFLRSLSIPLYSFTTHHSIIFIQAMPNNSASKTPKCPICLSKIRSQVKPNSCVHAFCYKCLKQWSKIEDKCPVCRERFSKIRKNGREKAGKQVKKEALKVEEKVESESVYVQGQLDQDSLLQESIFSTLMGPQTRTKSHKFLHIFSLLQEL